jgi:hypothetical protein
VIVSHVNIIISIIAGCAIIAGAILGVAKWWHIKIVESVKEELGVLHAAVTPNGGSSLRDAVDRIETETTRQGRELDRQGVELDRQGNELDVVSKTVERHLGFHEGLSTSP